MEWFALLIPVAVSCFLFFRFPGLEWWKCPIPILPVLLMILITQRVSESLVTSDYERHGGWVVEAQYFEDWDEWIYETCTRAVSCGKDCTTTETYDCSYRKYHPPVWLAIDSNGYSTNITSGEFEMLCSRLGNRQKIRLNRRFYWKDGDEFITRWDGKEYSRTPIVTEHRFVNKVKNAKGVYGYDKVVDPHSKGIFDYPRLAIPLDDPAILGHADGSFVADHELRRHNAILGRSKQVRMWILLFHNQPRSVGLEQEAHWHGGKKNEVTVCIGLGKTGNVEWCHPFCWVPDGNSSNFEMKTAIRVGIEQQISLDLRRAIELISNQVQWRFERKPFSEFQYFSVEVPAATVVAIYFLSVLISGGIGWFLVNSIDQPYSHLNNVFRQRRSEARFRQGRLS